METVSSKTSEPLQKPNAHHFFDSFRVQTGRVRIRGASLDYQEDKGRHIFPSDLQRYRPHPRGFLTEETWYPAILLFVEMCISDTACCDVLKEVRIQTKRFINIRS